VIVAKNRCNIQRCERRQEINARVPVSLSEGGVARVDFLIVEAEVVDANSVLNVGIRVGEVAKVLIAPIVLNYIGNMSLY